MIKHMSKVISLVIVLGMVIAGLAVVLPSINAQAPANKTQETKITEPIAMDVDSMMTKAIMDPRAEPYPSYGLSMLKPGANYSIGSVALYKTGSSGKWYYNGTSFSPLTSHPSSFMTFTKLGDNKNCEVWVANDLTFFPGDARNANPGKYVTVNQTQAQYMADQFNNSILPKMTHYFSAPPARDGENSIYKSQGMPYFGANVTGKAMIMVFNIVDDLFKDPTYPGGFVGGFFSSVNSKDYDRNIINLDNYDWKNRSGPESVLTHRFEYEASVAHEWQHMLMDIANPNQATWLNEGCSMYAEVLGGYPFGFWHALYFLATPDNSLTIWGDQSDYNILADYGAVGLFVTYIGDHFGATMIKDMANSKEIGVDAVNSALVASGSPSWDMNKVFNYWRLANLVRSNSPGNGAFNYKSVDLNFYAPYLYLLTGYTQGMHLLDYSTNEGYIQSRSNHFGLTLDLDGIPVGNGKLGPYSTDYIQVNGESDWAAFLNSFGLKYQFGGDLQTHTGWQEVTLPTGEGAMWSDDGDLIDWQMWGQADLHGIASPQLTINTSYSVEQGWDFVFVQVSTDGGLNWTSLSNQYTILSHDTDAMPSIVANLPGLTGDSGGFVTMSFDLGNYKGQNIMYRFRYMTDWGGHYGGIYIQSVKIDGKSVDLASLMTNSPPPANTDFMVSIYCPGATGMDGIYHLPVIMNLKLSSITESTLRTLTSYVVYPELYIIISPESGPADYGFGITNFGFV